MKKLVSLLTALALTASMAVLPAMAEGETEQAVAPTGDAVTVTALPKNTEITFNTTASYTANTKVGDYLAVYASTYIKADNSEGKRNIDIDTTGKTIEGVAYPGRLKTGGAAYKGEETDADYGTIKSRLISVTPAEAGTLSIIFAHASSSGTTRTFAINQSGKEIAAMDVEASEVKTIKANVAANVPVYIYSKSSGINIYSIKLNELDTSTPTPEPTAMPIVKLPKDTTIKFDTQKTISATELYNDNTIVYVGTGDSVTVDESNKTIDGRAYTTRMKFGSAKLNSSGIPTSRAFSIIPAADGILKVDFAATNKTDAKSLTAIQEGSESVTENVPADGTATLSMAVKADVPVYVYGADGANVYGYILVDASAEPDTPTDSKVSCVKVVATYVSGALTNVTFTPGEYTAADINGVTNTATEKTFYWKAITGDNAMEPVTVETPEPPAEPEPEPEWGWVAANDEAVKTDAALAADSAERTTKKGYELISGLTTLFDNVSTNKAYIAGGAAGEWSEPDSTSEKYNKASMLKYVATKDGVLYIKIDKLDATKEAAIIVEGTTSKQAVEDPSYIKATEDMTGVVIKREVEAGKTYLVTVKGATGRYNAAAFKDMGSK